MKIRPYQLELLEKARKSNIIAYMHTGSGKTLISIKLIQETLDNSDKKVLFLAPSNSLVHQQAISITNSIDRPVANYGFQGLSVLKYTLESWKLEFNDHSVFVMTPQTLIYLLQHAYIDLSSDISLLVFDECHHATKSSPYSQLMKNFYHTIIGERPKIMGLTASPIGGGKFVDTTKLEAALNDLEILLDSKLVMVEDQRTLDPYLTETTGIVLLIEILIQYITVSEITDSPISRMFFDDMIVLFKSIRMFFNITKEMGEVDFVKFGKDDMFKNAIADLKRNASVLEHEQKSKLESICKQLNFIMESSLTLGPLPAYLCIQQLLKSLQSVGQKRKAEELHCKLLDDIKTTDLSPKTWELIHCLKEHHEKSVLKGKRCIVFINQKMTAETLDILINFISPKFFPEIKSGFLTGSTNHRATLLEPMTASRAKEVLDKFNDGRINILLATRVAEEGIDIARCNFVIIFDFFRTSSGYVQSKGRAREKNSVYIVLLPKDDANAMKRLVEAKLAEKNIEVIVRNEVKKDFDIIESDGFVKLISGEMDKGLVTNVGASIFPFSAGNLLRWFCESNAFMGSVLLSEVWPGDTVAWDLIITNLKIQWDIGLGNPEERDILLGDVPGDIGYIYSSRIRYADVDVTLYGSLRATKKSAQNSASFVTCQFLYREKQLTEYLLPIKQPKSLVKRLKNESFLDNVPKKIPAAFENGENHTKFYVTVFEIVPKDGVDILEPFVVINRNHIGILTVGEIQTSAISKFQIWLKQKHVSYVNVIYSRLYEFDFIQMKQVLFFQKFIWDCALNSTTLEEEEEVDSRFYHVVPMFVLDGEFVIDWEYLSLVSSQKSIQLDQFINSCQNNWKLSEIAEQSNISLDVMNLNLNHALVKTRHNDMVYKNLSLKNEIASKTFSKKQDGKVRDISFQEYFTELGYGNISGALSTVRASQIGLIRNCTQEDLKTAPAKPRYATLVQEACEVIPCTARYMYLIQAIPSILYFIESHCHIHDFFSIIDLEPIPHDIIYPAFFSAGSEQPNYERLETLGDAFLKYAVTVELYSSKPDEQEGQLTNSRSNLVSNLNLYNICKRFGLEGMVELSTFEAGNWLPPTMKSKLKERLISSKTQADFIEALIGAFTLHGGEQLGWKFLEKCNILTSKVIITSIENPKKHPLEAKLGYSFKNHMLLVQSFNHKSKHILNYDRLEFLGDAVLDYLLISYLFKKYPHATPGDLSNLRTTAVNNEGFCFFALELEMDLYIDAQKVYQDSIRKYKALMQDGFDADVEGPKILGDCFEALVGAIYIDTGCDLEKLWGILFPLWEGFLNNYVTIEKVEENPVRILNQVLQFKGMNSLDLEYCEKVVDGDHVCVIKLDGYLIAEGKGITKKTAKKRSARGAMLWVNSNVELVENLRKEIAF